MKTPCSDSAGRAGQPAETRRPKSQILLGLRTHHTTQPSFSSLHFPGGKSWEDRLCWINRQSCVVDRISGDVLAALTAAVFGDVEGSMKGLTFANFSHVD
jgi:hypothetical protein